MKRFPYLMAVALIGASFAASCNNDDPGPNGNYGDLSVRPQMAIAGFYSKNDPSKAYEMKIDGSQPTDTFFEEQGKKATYCVYQPVTVPCDADTFIMRVNSNARWSSSTPTKTGLFIVSGIGNGDADVTFRCTRNSSKNNDRVRYMYFYSNDSSTMHKVTIVQEKTPAE